MPPQFSYIPRRHIQGSTGYRVQPYDSYSYRHADFISPYFAMTEPNSSKAEDSVIAMPGGEQKKGRRRNRKKKHAQSSIEEAETEALSQSNSGQYVSHELEDGGVSLNAWDPSYDTPSPANHDFQSQKARNQVHNQIYDTQPSVTPTPEYEPPQETARSRRAQQRAEKKLLHNSSPLGGESSFQINDEFKKLNLSASYSTKKKGNWKPSTTNLEKVKFAKGNGRHADPGEAYHIKYLKQRGLYPEQEKEVLAVPQPNVKYLDTAVKPTWLLKNSQNRKLCVVLDINGTLLYRVLKSNGKRDNNNPLRRPFLSQFLDYLFKEHHVVIFSSMTQLNVLRLLRGIIPEPDRPKILRIFTREDMGIPTQHFNQKIVTYKHLKNVWEVLAAQNPTEWKFSQYDTVLIDDSDKKAASEPFNHIMIPEFTQELFYQGKDVALNNAVEYLEELRKWHNVSSYIKSNPFDLNQEYTRERLEAQRSRIHQVEAGLESSVTLGASNSEPEGGVRRKYSSQGIAPPNDWLAKLENGAAERSFASRADGRKEDLVFRTSN